MRFHEFAIHARPDTDRLRLCTLYVPEGRFPSLTACRLAHGSPTQIVAVRSLAPQFSGCSVDLLCNSAASAMDLLVAWGGSGGHRDGGAATG
jgi:hypothetical protein